MPPNSLILSSVRPDDKFKLWSVGGVFEEVADCYHTRWTKQYDVGDGIRDELKRKYDVSMDDRSMELRASRRRKCGCMKEIYY